MPIKQELKALLGPMSLQKQKNFKKNWHGCQQQPVFEWKEVSVWKQPFLQRSNYLSHFGPSH